MSHTTNWRPDPYGVHEFRFFSADGKPTLLVMDGGHTSYDQPPPIEPSVILEPERPSPVPPTENAIAIPLSDSESRSPSLPPAPVTSSEAEETQANHSVALGTTLGKISNVSEEQVGQATAHNVPEVEGIPPTADTAHREIGPIGRPLKIAYGIVIGLLAVSALGFLLVHLPHSAKGSPPHRAAVTTTTKVSAHQSTSRTVALPTALKPSAEAAAQALVSSWSADNRLAALSVATPAAATSLFAFPYNSGLAIDRGCSASFTPIVCTFGPPGGASPTDPIYQILVKQVSGGWYVSSVKIEN